MAVNDPALVAVVAMAENGVIGDAGAMPWRMPSDLKRYRRLTMGKPMIMGRKTLDSIGRVLDGRDSIVLSRAERVPYEGAILAGTPDEALDRARDAAAARGADEIVVGVSADRSGDLGGRIGRALRAGAEGQCRQPLHRLCPARPIAAGATLGRDRTAALFTICEHPWANWSHSR